MASFRTATENDIPQLLSLWQECFGDSDEFCDWFFSERFSAELSIVAEENGGILSAIHGWPFVLRIRNKSIPAIMMCGVSTRPAARGRGLMKGCISLFMNIAREKGFLVLLQKPVDFNIYHRYGHYASYDAAIFTKKDGIIYHPARNTLDTLCSAEYANELLPIYQAAMEKYSCGVIRTPEDMALKLRDYAADGGRLLRSTSSPAYAIYYFTESQVAVPEIMGSPQGVLPLMHTVAAMATNRKLTIKAPMDWAFDDFTSTISPWGAMTALNAPALMNELCGSSHLAAEISDPVLPQNNGVFSFDGTPASTAHIRLETGRLMQLLSGYADISALLSQGHAELLAPIADTLIECLPSCPCFTVEEY